MKPGLLLARRLVLGDYSLPLGAVLSVLVEMLSPGLEALKIPTE